MIFWCGKEYVFLIWYFFVTPPAGLPLMESYRRPQSAEFERKKGIVRGEFFAL